MIQRQFLERSVKAISTVLSRQDIGSTSHALDPIVCFLWASVLPTMQLESRTQLNAKFPNGFTKLRCDVPRAGTPQLLQSGAMSVRPFTGINATTQRANLCRPTRGHQVAKKQESRTANKVHGPLVELTVK